MTIQRLVGLVAGATVLGMGAAIAQVVPPEVMGEYAIGSCAAPDVTVTIDEAGMTVVDPADGSVITDVAAQSAQATDDGLEMRVVVDGEESGLMTLVDLGGGALNVIYAADGGSEEPPQRLELCAAAAAPPEPGEPVAEPEPGPTVPGDGAPLVPNVLLGEFAAGSCAAPDERLVIEATQVEAFGGSGRSLGAAQVLDVREASGGYVLVVEFEGQEATLELTLINQDIVEAVFVDSGGAGSPETLYRCTPLVVGEEPERPVTPITPDEPDTSDAPAEPDAPDEPRPDETMDEPAEPATEMTTLPEAYQGEYALGDSCAEADTTIVFGPDRLEVFEGGRFEVSLDVESVTATSPDLAFVVSSEGRVADAVMESIGGDTYQITFTDRDGGTDDVEIVTMCAPAVSTADDGTPTAAIPSDPGQYIFDEPVARFAGLMAELEAVCQPGSEQQCLDVFWAFADVTGDGELTGPELARVMRYGTKWAVSENLPVFRLGQKLSIHLATMVTGPLAANGMIYNHDYDGNNALSQAELFPEGVASAPVAMPALMELISQSTLEDVLDALDELERM